MIQRCPARDGSLPLQRQTVRQAGRIGEVGQSAIANDLHSYVFPGDNLEVISETCGEHLLK